MNRGDPPPVDATQGGLPMRALARPALVGALVGPAIAAMAGHRLIESYVVLVLHGAVLGALMRGWVGRLAPRRGRAARVSLVVAAGVLLFAAEWEIFHAAEALLGGLPNTDLPLSRHLLELLVTSVLATAAPALLLALRAERAGIIPGWAWWPQRGLGAAVIGALLSATGIMLLNTVSMDIRMRWSEPWELLMFFAAEEPSILLAMLGPTTLLAVIVGADPRWRDAGGTSSPGTAPARS